MSAKVEVMAVSTCRKCGQREVHEATLTIELFGTELSVHTSAPEGWREYHHVELGHLMWCSSLCMAIDDNGRWRDE